MAADVSFNPSAGESRFWRRKTLRAALTLNLAWWYEKLLPSLVAAAVCYVIVVLAGRRASWRSEWLLVAGAFVFGCALVASFLSARRHFVSKARARAELDYALRLHNRLSAAAGGVGNWPGESAWHSGFWKWNWKRLMLVPSACFLLVAASFWIPIGRSAAMLPPPVIKPPALEEVDDWLEKLAETPAIDPKSLEEMKQEAERLEKESPEQQYSHSSLEAAEHLKAGLQAGLQSLDANASKLSSLLDQAGGEQGFSELKMQAVTQGLNDALNALEGNVPGLSNKVSSALRKIDPSNLHQLSSRELQQLKQNLSQCQGACQHCLGGHQPGEQGGSAPQTGNGGPGGGGGPAPLSLNPEATDLKTNKTEPLGQENLEHAALGDKAGTSAAQHDVDKTTDHRAASGGAAAATGEGASAVWVQQNVTPDEQRKLQQFFK